MPCEIVKNRPTKGSVWGLVGIAFKRFLFSDCFWIATIVYKSQRIQSAFFV